MKNLCLEDINSGTLAYVEYRTCIEQSCRFPSRVTGSMRQKPEVKYFTLNIIKKNFKSHILKLKKLHFELLRIIIFSGAHNYF